MSILNVNEIQPVGGGNTITVSAADINASSSALNVNGITVTSGNLSGISTVSTTNLTVNGNNYPSAGSLGRRNLIINGNPIVYQRAQTASNIASYAYHTADRWRVSANVCRNHPYRAC